MAGAQDTAVLLLIPGTFISLLGLLIVALPYRVARFQQQMDAIGSTRSFEDVEPSEWNIHLNRLIGVCILLPGMYLILAGFGFIPF